MPQYTYGHKDGSQYTIDAADDAAAQRVIDEAFGEAAKPAPQQSGSTLANVGAGSSDMIAGAAGMPVDAMAWVLNKAAQYGAGRTAPWVTNPVGGSESIKSAMGLIGADPRNVPVNTTGDQIAREIGGAIPATVAPYLGARAAIERGANGLLPRILGGRAGPGQTAAQTVAGSIGNAATATGGVLGGHAAENMVGADSPYRSTANLVGQLGGGALTSGVLSKAANTAANIVQGQTSPDVQALMAAGVRPTAGQIIGGKFNRAEEGLMSIPLVGDAIKGARERANEQFNRAAINRSLHPIGEALDTATPVGREAIEEAWQKSSAAYQNAVPQADMFLTPKAVSDLNGLYGMAQNLPDQHRDAFNRYMKTSLIDRLSPNGHISGEAFKDAEADLGKKAAGFMKNPNSTEWDKDLGNALFEAQRILRQSLGDTNPQIAAQIRDANATHAAMLRVGNASARPGADPGVFTPAQLQSSVKKYGTDRQYQKGGALLQDLADAGRSVLGNRVPDSGTPYRGMLPLLAGTAMLDPSSLAKVGLGAAGAMGLYSRPAQNAMASLLTARPQGAQPIADTIRALSPPMGSAMSYPLAGLLAP